jgi:hypothetical protein
MNEVKAARVCPEVSRAHVNSHLYMDETADNSKLFSPISPTYK